MEMDYMSLSCLTVMDKSGGQAYIYIARMIDFYLASGHPC